MLSIRTITNKEIPVIEVKGELKVGNKTEIEEAVNSVLTPGSRQLILDLTGITSLDADETQAIIEAVHRSLGQGGRLALVISEKDKENALREARILDDPGVMIFPDAKKAFVYLGERGIDMA